MSQLNIFSQITATVLCQFCSIFSLTILPEKKDLKLPRRTQYTEQLVARPALMKVRCKKKKHSGVLSSFLINKKKLIICLQLRNITLATKLVMLKFVKIYQKQRKNSKEKKEMLL